MKKFSFVICTYQRKALLKNTLEVLNRQAGFGREDYEVILVDDGSADHTEEYIRGVNRNYDLKYIFLERTADSCRARPRNTGWKAASGEIVVFIDSDILVKPDYLNELTRCFSLEKDLVVIGNRILLFQDLDYATVCDQNRLEKEVYPVKAREQLEERHFKYFYAFSYNAAFQYYPWLQVFGGNMAAPRAWLQKTGGFDENFKGWGLEDVEAGYMLYRAGLKIIINSKLEVFHQNHPDSDNLHINEKKYEQIDKNTGYFLSKHPGVIAEPEAVIYKYLRGLHAPVTLYPRPKFFSKKIVLNFRDKERLINLKQDIKKFSAQKGLCLVVNDYREDTDLDIWIQLLGKRPSTPLYFPVSKIQEIHRFIPAREIWYSKFTRAWT